MTEADTCNYHSKYASDFKESMKIPEFSRADQRAIGSAVYVLEPPPVVRKGLPSEEMDPSMEHRNSSNEW